MLFTLVIEWAIDLMFHLGPLTNYIDKQGGGVVCQISMLNTSLAYVVNLSTEGGQNS